MICLLFFDRFRKDFGVENPSKIGKKSIEKSFKNKMRFWMDFGGLLGHLWQDSGAKLGGNLGAKSV